MKKEKFDFTFKVKDFEKTSLKHESRVKKISLSWKEIETEVSTSEINYIVTSSTQYQYWFLREDVKKNKSTVKMLKTLVNGKTCNILQSIVEYHNLPRSYVTALYVKFYKAINRRMSTVTRQLVASL